MLRQALSALGVRAASALMVGDRRGSDVAAGRAAGVGTVWLRREDGGGPKPDHVIDRLDALPGLLDRLARRPG
jgi:FMN phosphatase YigB (HAD superfamily)